MVQAVPDVESQMGVLGGNHLGGNPLSQWGTQQERELERGAGRKRSANEEREGRE